MFDMRRVDWEMLDKQYQELQSLLRDKPESILWGLVEMLGDMLEEQGYPMSKETDIILANRLVDAWYLFYGSDNNEGNSEAQRVRVEAGDRFDTVYQLANERWKNLTAPKGARHDEDV